MKRSIAATLLAGLMLVGTAPGATPNLGKDPQIQAAQNIAFGTFYRRIGNTNRYVFVCEASAFGGIVVFTAITACSMSGSNGGFAKGVTPVVYPGLEAITVGQGVFNPGVYTICITANALYANLTNRRETGCEIASILAPG